MYMEWISYINLLWNMLLAVSLTKFIVELPIKRRSDIAIIETFIGIR